MRTSLFALLVAVALLGAPAVTGTTLAAPAVALELDQQGQPPQPPQPPSGRLEIDIDTEEGGAWYTNPVWMAIGAIALVLIIALAVMAGRGGGTTVVRG